MDYTDRIDGYQIRDASFCLCDDVDERVPLEFDIVRWQQHGPMVVRDFTTGLFRTPTESCYSIGFLVWNPHEPCFYLKSVGLRWIEEGAIHPRFLLQVLGFADRMQRLLIDNDLVECSYRDIKKIRRLWVRAIEEDRS